MTTDLEKTLAPLLHNLGYFPRKALEKVIREKDATLPHLKEFLEFYTRHTVLPVHSENTLLPVYAMYLLAQFRDKDAWKIIINLLSIDDENTLEFYSDFFIESIPRVLASVYDGNIDLLKQIIEDKKIYETIRGGGLQTFSTLVNAGFITRQEAIAYFKELYHGKLEKKASYVWTTLAGETVNLHPEELYTEVREALDKEYADPDLVSDTFLTDAMNATKEQSLYLLKEDPDYSLIDDTIAELENWEEFKKPAVKVEEKAPAPPMNKREKIGRNDPCPCGSGKKYKKCCEVTKSI